MIELFELKVHNATFNVELHKHDDEKHPVSYATYVQHGNSGDLLIGDFPTINEVIEWIKSEGKSSAESYIQQEHELMDSYKEECFCEDKWWKEIPDGTMLNNLWRERYRDSIVEGLQGRIVYLIDAQKGD